MTQNLDLASPTVIELAKDFMTLLQRIAPGWTQGYWRFDCDPTKYGSNASYVTPRGVFLIDTIEEDLYFEKANEMGVKLWEQLDRKFKVCLLVVTSSFDYKIKFENSDASKWRITKIDGATGIPQGL